MNEDNFVQRLLMMFKNIIETFKLISHKEDPIHQLEIALFLRQKLIPLGFVEEKGSRSFSDYIVFRRERFAVEFGIDNKDGLYFFNTGHGTQSFDVYLLGQIDPLNKKNNLESIETFKIDVRTNLGKWLTEIGLTAV